MDSDLNATFDACNTFNNKLKDTLQGLIGANNDRKSEIDALRLVLILWKLDYKWQYVIVNKDQLIA